MLKCYKSPKIGVKVPVSWVKEPLFIDHEQGTWSIKLEEYGGMRVHLWRDAMKARGNLPY